MSDAPNIAEPSGLKMIAVMGLIGLGASILLVATYRTTLPYVEANRQAYLEQAVFDVLPRTSRKATFTVEKGVVEPLVSKEQPGVRVHAGYDSLGTLTGIAIEARGQGFQDVLKILIGYNPACECVVGMKVLESKETPGLGDKIETDERFRSNFDSLDVRLSPDGRKLVEKVILVKKGEKHEAWQIEAITGATISSRAITSIIDASAADLLPVIRANLDIIKEGR